MRFLRGKLRHNTNPCAAPVRPGRAPEFNGGQLNETQVLNQAENYLGTGYREVSPGRFHLQMEQDSSGMGLTKHVIQITITRILKHWIMAM